MNAHQLTAGAGIGMETGAAHASALCHLPWSHLLISTLSQAASRQLRRGQVPTSMQLSGIFGKVIDIALQGGRSLGAGVTLLHGSL